MKNKKGLVTDFGGDFLAFLFFIISALAFFLLFSVTLTGCNKRGAEVNIASTGLNRIGEEQMLMNFLRTRVSVGAEYLSFAQLISKTYLENDFKEFEEKTLSFLEKMDQNIYGESRCSVVCIDISANRELIVKTKSCKTNVAWQCRTASIEIPLITKDRPRKAVVWLTYNALSFDDNSPYGSTPTQSYYPYT